MTMTLLQPLATWTVAASVMDGQERIYRRQLPEMTGLLGMIKTNVAAQGVLSLPGYMAVTAWP